MPSEDFVAARNALAALGGQRVWSLMITLFGDLAQGDGDVIDGPVLSAIMAGLDIRPEAARVALHRLRNDGWITSAKHGRISRHSLTPKARTMSAEASPRIYARPDAGSSGWQCVILQSGAPDDIATMATRGFAPLMPRVFVGPPDCVVPQGALILEGSDVPGWLLDQLAPNDLSEDYEALHAALDRLRNCLPDIAILRPLDIAVLRCLIVHNWRRLVLKHPDLPAPLRSADAPDHRCHLLVADLLGRLPRPALRDVLSSTAGA